LRGEGWGEGRFLAYGRAAQAIGTAVSDPQKIVRIPARGLAGQHKRFWREDAAARRVG